MIVGQEVFQAAHQLPLPDAFDLLKLYVREHMADQLRVKHLASLVALSPFYFVRMFKQHVGVTPHAYVTNVRIERACELLTTSSLSATQICPRVGFTTLSHFTNTFRKHTGMSPIAYRRAMAEPVRRGSWHGSQDPARAGQELAIRPGLLLP